MRDAVHRYMKAKNDISRYFNLKNDYFIRVAIDLKWLIKSVDDVLMLTYWAEDGKETDAVIVRREGKPLVHHAGDYTVVIAIECIKVAFIFKNSNSNNTGDTDIDNNEDI